MFSLKEKVAIVTGSSSGIGKAIAIGFAKAGADVVTTFHSKHTGTGKEIKGLGRRNLDLKVDVAKRNNVMGLVRKTLKVFGKIDILVNNAGTYYPTPVETVKEKDWRKILEVNLMGAFYCAQEAGKIMIKQKSGNIINIASIAGKLAGGNIAAYNTSKGALIMFTKSLAIDWAKHNIRVNAICPGIVKTNMTAGLLKDKGFRKAVKTKVPLARSAEPEEIVGAAVYLASDASSYTTGHSLVVDGGWIAGL